MNLACARLGVLSLVLAGCGPATETMEPTDTSETTGTTGASETDGQASAAEPPEPPENVLECGAPSPCGIVLGNSRGPDVPPATAYTPAQTCALQALAQAGPLRLHYNDSCEGGCAGALILIRGDGSAIVQPYAEVFPGGVDLDGISAELAPLADSLGCAVQPPSFFEACLAAFDNACTARVNWFDGCARPAPAACTP